MNKPTPALKKILSALCVLNLKKYRKTLTEELNENKNKIKELLHKINHVLLFSKDMYEKDNLKSLRTDIENLKEIANKLIQKEKESQMWIKKVIINFLIKEEKINLYEGFIQDIKKLIERLGDKIKDLENILKRQIEEVLQENRYLHTERCRKEKGDKKIVKIEENLDNIKILHSAYEALIKVSKQLITMCSDIKKQTKIETPNPIKQRITEDLFYRKIEEHNYKFIRKEIERLEKKGFWESLDEYQKKAVLIDPPQLLIKARAGSGKTTVLLKKFHYLISEKKIPPKKILFLSFQKKVEEEIKDRIKKKYGKENLPRVFTFHSFGSQNIRPMKKDEKADIIFEAINKVKESIPFEELILFSKLIDRLTDQKIDAHNIEEKNIVKSRGEEKILSFLINNKIEIRINGKTHKAGFSYEKPLEIEKQNRVYPDFTIHIEIEKEKFDVYWEHVGIRKIKEKLYKGINEEYIKAYKEKRKKYKKLHLPLIETWLWVFDKIERKYKDNPKRATQEINKYIKKRIKRTLKKAIKKKGKKVEIIISIDKEGVDERRKAFLSKYEKSLKNIKATERIKEFIRIVKNNTLSHEEVIKRGEGYYIIARRNRYSLKKVYDVLWRIKEEYEKIKNVQRKFDFEDLLKNAIERTKREKIEYIFVDEFQDTNNLRSEIIESLLSNTQAKLVVVGDDSQAIMGFTGSSARYFKEFSNLYYGRISKECSKEVDLPMNYRNPSDIVEYTSTIINKEQKAKRKKMSGRIHIVTEDDLIRLIKQLKELLHHNQNKEFAILLRSRSESSRLKENLERVLKDQEIEKEKHLKELIEKIVLQLKEYSEKEEEKTKKTKIKKNTLVISTIHAVKGLEFDYVILPNITTDGFPDKYKKMIDFLTPLGYVSTKEKEIEEENLLYVALTRTKEHVFLLTEKKKENDVIKKIRKFKEKNIKG